MSQLNNDIFIDRDLNSAINIAKKCKVLWFDQFLDKINCFNLNKMYLNTVSKLKICI